MLGENPLIVEDREEFMIRKIVFVIAAAVLVLPALALAQAGVQLTPDSARYLISKDVGPERWAISVNVEDRTATGNVFKTDGSPTSFVWCDITNIDANTDPEKIEFTLSCWGADACASAPCNDSEWSFIASGIKLDGSFMLPPNTQSTLSGNVQSILTQRCATSPGCHMVGGGGNVDLADGATWAATFGVGTLQRPGTSFVEPFDADASYLIAKITGNLATSEGSRMPLAGAPLSAQEIQTIRRWIDEGAVDN